MNLFWVHTCSALLVFDCSLFLSIYCTYEFEISTLYLVLFFFMVQYSFEEKFYFYHQYFESHNIVELSLFCCKSKFQSTRRVSKVVATVFQTICTMKFFNFQILQKSKLLNSRFSSVLFQKQHSNIFNPIGEI